MCPIREVLSAAVVVVFVERPGVRVAAGGQSHRGRLQRDDRAVARGLVPRESTVREVMSAEVKYVYDDESVRDVATVMGDLQVRRLPVLDRHKRLVGIVSLGDLARAKPASAGDALQAIAEAPAGTLA